MNQMIDTFNTAKQQFLSEVDALLHRDLNRLSRFGNISFDYAPYHISANDFATLASSFMEVTLREIDYSAFDAWYTTNDYRLRFPNYTKTYPNEELLKKKAFEHWLSLFETETSVGGTVLDVGCATSPFWEVIQEDHPRVCDICYRVDLPLPEYGYQPGIHGNVIGAGASEIPLPESSVARIYSHNAIEHFEGSVYFKFFAEAARLLKPGGTIYICPLFYARKRVTYVSLVGIYRRLSFPALTRGSDMVYSDKIGQPYAVQIDAADLETQIVQKSKALMKYTLLHYTNAGERDYGVQFALCGVRLQPPDQHRTS